MAEQVNKELTEERKRLSPMIQAALAKAEEAKASDNEAEKNKFKAESKALAMQQKRIGEQINGISKPLEITKKVHGFE